MGGVLLHQCRKAFQFPAVEKYNQRLNLRHIGSSFDYQHYSMAFLLIMILLSDKLFLNNI